jgi:hypothetical protein
VYLLSLLLLHLQLLQVNQGLLCGIHLFLTGVHCQQTRKHCDGWC